MKKIFIAALFLLMSLGVQAQIAYNPYASLGATSAVDFARITEGYFPEGNIIFYVGELTFNATIFNTKPPYSANELSKIIKEVMNDLGVTEGMLEGINNDLAERDQITAQQWHDLVLKALDIVGSSDLNPVADVYKYGCDKINAARQGQTLEQMTIDPSQVTPEIDLSDIPELQGIPTMSPKMKQLQKRMTELAQELQAHPERSAKIQKEMQCLGEEMAREAEKMQK